MCTIFINMLDIHVVVVGHNIDKVIFIPRRDEEITNNYQSLKSDGNNFRV